MQIQLEQVELDQSNLMAAPVEMKVPVLAASTAQGWSRWRRSALLDLLAQLHGFYGYADAGTWMVVGTFWSLIKGFVHFGIFVWLYNLFLGKG